MANIILFHSVLGLREGVLDAADRLRQAGHTVHTPDLWTGEIFTDQETAQRRLQEVGFPQIMARAGAAVASLPAALVYAGFSVGGNFAQSFAAKRPGAKGCLLFHSALPLAALRQETWPAAVPVQVHFAQNDTWRKQEAIDALKEDVGRSGAVFEAFDYPCSGHLFADPGLPDYDRGSAALMWERVLEFLRKIDATR